VYTWLVYEFSNGGRRGDHLREKGERVMRSGTQIEEWRGTSTEEKGIGRERAANELECNYGAILQVLSFQKIDIQRITPKSTTMYTKNICTHIV